MSSKKYWLSLRWISTDGKILLITKFLRTLTFGYLSVSLPFYLGKDVLKLSDFTIGVVLAVALIGGVFFTVLGSLIANRMGRRLTLEFFAIFMLASGVLFISFTNIYIILLAVFIGSIGVNATETGPFVSLESAIMPQTTEDKNRTYAFSLYNLLGYAAASFGSLLGILPSLFNSYLGWSVFNGYQLLFALYGLSGAALAICYVVMSSKSEVERPTLAFFGLKKSRGIVARLSILFSIDAFGGGFVIQAVLSFWFLSKFNTPLSSVSTIFFGSQLITAASFLLAGRLAKKIGLLNTMVFTHIPSNLLLIAVAFSPTFALSGYLIGIASLAAPFVFAGALKTFYDVAIYLSFRKIKPPEEECGKKT